MNQPGPKSSNRPLAVPRQRVRDEMVYGGDGDVAIEVDNDDTQPERKNLNKKELRK